MAGTSLQFGVTIDDRAVRRRLNDLIRRGEDLAPLLSDIGEYLDLAHRDRWDKEIDPDGAPWLPLALSTREAKERKGRDNGILIESTDLRDLLRYQIGTNVLDFGTDRIYGATQHFGDDDRGIPARAWLGFSDQDLDAIQDIVRDYIAS